MKITLPIRLIAIAFFAVIQLSKAQMVYIPDANFKNKLTSLGFGACITGDSINSACAPVSTTTTLDVSASSITNLQGIQAFVALDRLNCNSNSGLAIPALPLSLDTLYARFCSLSTMPALPSSMLYLDIGYNNFSSLPALPGSMRVLYVNDNQLSSITSLPDSLRNFICSSNTILSLPTLPSMLNDLACGDNDLNSLPALPSTLIYLDCHLNNISTLPALSPVLEILRCYQNSLTALPPIPATLTNLYCDQNQLTELPALSPVLVELTCIENQITYLPSLPVTLSWLECSFNLLDSLPQLPDGLDRLICVANNITTLPALPDSMEYLNFSVNLVTALPPLPVRLLSLECDDNMLSSIPTLPDDLEFLSCVANQITSLPRFPNRLRRIFCADNLFTSIPAIPDSVVDLMCEDNPNLVCLPLLTKITNLDFTNTSVTCIPNVGEVTNSVPDVLTMPICDLYNSGACEFYRNINGHAYLDSDSNCLLLHTEPYLPNLKLSLFDDIDLVSRAITNANGFYSFDVLNFGDYFVRIDTNGLPFVLNCPPTGIHFEEVGNPDTVFYDDDYALLCKQGFDLSAWSVSSVGFVPGTNSIVNIGAGDLAGLYGARCAGGVGGTVNIELYGNLTYVAPAPGALIPSSVTGNIITYNVLDFGTVNTATDFGIELMTDNIAAVGSSVCITVSIPVIAGDNNPDNNSVINCYSVLSSLGSNFKNVYPEGVIDTSQQWLTYTVQFQNTGNAPVEHIEIIDTLDASLDAGSLQIIGASHQSYVEIVGNVVHFNFAGINLPDSFSGGSLSRGYIQFRVRIHDFLPIGTQINNTAHINFDFINSVATNTTIDIIDLPNSVKKNDVLQSVKVWPQPFRSNFVVDVNSAMIGKAFTIVNIQGVKISEGLISSVQFRVNSENWSNGVYFFRIDTEEGAVVRKIVKN